MLKLERGRKCLFMTQVMEPILRTTAETLETKTPAPQTQKAKSTGTRPSPDSPLPQQEKPPQPPTTPESGVQGIAPGSWRTPPPSGSTTGVTIPGRTPTSRNTYASSISTPDGVDRGTAPSTTGDGETTGVGISSSTSVPGSTSGVTPSSRQINPSKSPHRTTALVRGEVRPHRSSPLDSETPTSPCHKRPSIPATTEDNSRETPPPPHSEDPES